MINHLKHMAIFASVVDEGSFRGAARLYAVAPSRISQTVSDLEEFLGTTLLHRTTRKISLTSEGKVFFECVKDMLRGVEEGMNSLNAVIAKPIGDLNISMPSFMATSELAILFAEFIKQYPQVSINIVYTDRSMDMIDHGFDLSIRAGWLSDSSMMSRKLGESKRVLVASAKYANSHPRPVHPKDLEAWDWIHYAQRSDVAELTSPDGELVKVTGHSRLKVDSIDALLHFVRQDLGVTIAPRYIVEGALTSGEFVELLPEWSMLSLGYYAVWPDTSRRENLTLFLVRFLADRLPK